MRKRKYSGRQLVLYGALALAVWAGYECYIRLEMLKWFFDGLIRMSFAEGIPIWRAVSYFDKAMFRITAYLSALTLYAIASIILRNRPIGDYVILLLTIALGISGGMWANLYDLSVFNWAQSLKLLPLLMIAAGCVVNISQFYASKGEKRRNDDEEECDYTKMDRRGLAKQVKKQKRHKNEAA